MHRRRSNQRWLILEFAFSKIEADKLVFEDARFDARAAVAEVADLLAPQADAKRLELALRLSAALPARVVGDAGRVRQVLLNAANALKFTQRDTS